MPAGSASRTQSLLDFKIPSQKNSTDIIRDQETRQQSQPQKRPRTELEVPHIIMDEGNGTNSNNPFDSTSTTTIVEANTHDNTEERTKCVRLDRLRNKEERYDSHITFLKDCIAIKRIPKGLVINLEPSIGNNDEEFLAKWYQRLEEFSMIMMKDVIDYSERIKAETKEKVTTEQESLRTSMKPEDFKEVSHIMDQNSAERKRALQTTKRKKFNYLKYHRENPMQQRVGLRTAENEGTSREPYSDNRRENNNQFDRRIDDHQNRSWKNRTENRTRNNYGTTIRNAWNPPTDNRTRNEYRTAGRNAWNQPKPNARRDKNNNDLQQSEHNSLWRTNSRNFLSAKSSWNSIQNDDNRNEGRDQRTDAKDKEIQYLQERIASLGTNQSRETQAPKNGEPPIGGLKTGQPNAEQVLNFITNTMNTLEEFKKHFATQPHTNKTQ